MRETFYAALFAVISTLGILAVPATAFAADVSDELAACAAAADLEGIAAAADYRPKFVKIRGGSMKKLTIKFIPTVDGDAIVTECQIKRGEVLDVSVKA